MDMRPLPFEPPAPIPPAVPPSGLQLLKTALRNPLELWGEQAYTQPWVDMSLLGQRAVIINDPALIRYVMVENSSNYEMSAVRQLVLKPILRDGLLTAEGEVWKRSRKAMAPVFTPRHAKGFAGQMLRMTERYARKYEQAQPFVSNIAKDMTELTFDILSETLFSGEIATETEEFAQNVDKLLHRMGRVDPMDMMIAPAWVPRVTRFGGRKMLNDFRRIVGKTMDARRERMRIEGDAVPQDFLTLLLKLEGPDGLSQAEIDDNILTFIGAGHETTARALAWTLYCVANAPHVRDRMEAEIDSVLGSDVEPVEWLDKMPMVRAAFEEAMRLYPPAPSINRAAIKADSWTSPSGETLTLEAGTPILVMPWTLHRHTLYWERPRAFMPERFLPENRDKIHRFQYLPFGAGPRVCIGATFAMQEAVIALSVLMHGFRFDMTPETHPWPVQKLTTQPNGGLPMRVSLRERMQ
ncbi:cytochrome P450 [Rhizobium sp. CFBP 8762]|uniref:cytochrome P450 n=1 Tax=Rhizobium sp. CFBP 8762 TaxID=2775279 RepID=UPI001785CEB8|nr:cytochrome P450 [Rhizobium sp. CFBP 8762]MBD8556807.1 cytochrome P450 [Rhizobium sp. CFBP 8762]